MFSLTDADRIDVKILVEKFPYKGQQEATEINIPRKFIQSVGA